MEKLNDSKFQQLTSEEMSLIEGGGWRVDEFKVYYDPYSGCNRSNIIMQRYTIFGKATGEYDTSYDVC